MCGLGTRSAQLAGIALIISHALFKSALFLVVGIVDTRTGTRDLRRALRRGPVDAVGRRRGDGGGRIDGGHPADARVHQQGVGVRGADLPRGRRRRHPVPPVPALLLTATVVAGSALTVAYTLRFLWGAFATKELPSRALPSAGWVRSPPCRSCWPRAPWSAASSGHALTDALQPAVDLVTVGDGGTRNRALARLHACRSRCRASHSLSAPRCSSADGHVARVQSSLPHVADAEEVYQKLMRGIDRFAVEVTARTQRGSLPIYLGVILVVLGADARRGAVVRRRLARGAGVRRQRRAGRRRPS